MKRASLFLLLGLASGLPQDEPELPPEEVLLDRAKKRIAVGRYKDAWRLYRDLAEKYPDTEAGRIGARRSRESGFLGETPLVVHGPSENRFDVALMGDGYRIDRQKGFDKLARSIPDLFTHQDTFREYFSYFNFHRVNLVSKDDGVDGFGREEDTALNARVSETFAGHVAVDRKRVFDMLTEMEHHDRMAIVFVRAGALGTGGGGVATIGGRNARTTIHEFGHAFCGLGDEYSTKTHERGGVRDNVNVSAVEDPEKVPWAHWIEARVPGVGVYEGAAGQVRDAWRPTASGCVMQDGEFFCEPCREAIVLRIYSVVDPIEWVQPDPHPVDTREELVVSEPTTFQIKVLTPERHRLEVRWWLLPASDGPASPELGPKEWDRRKRGPLPAIAEKPAQMGRNDARGEYSFRVSPNKVDPGRYRLVVRALDTTKLRGERFPWVLKDDRGVLESERGWTIRVAED